MDMKERILDIAQRLIQQRGVNGFSYADIAKELGIAKASLHHHFATKTDLVKKLMENYTETLTQFLSEVSSQPVSATEKITAYASTYQHTLSCGRICMGAMLAAEAMTLDESIFPLLSRFFEIQADWLSAQLELGKVNGEFRFAHSAKAEACSLIAGLQGALVVSRSTQNSVFFEQTLEGLLAHLKYE